ncbi:ABC-2 type transport system ATP-binding protein [Natronoarchaeum philippinense]|uniref:ABC-2 type transport system ATP-binding protein n=1 Tax=Natronoarchaeum philippinense TaxID=558529 RepID=A0A285N0J9_NATPI|nr:ABC transporter ATP-binding protein [Natronoarchaeum philippinense]SNZ02985.1 ABC-2 type transport system ATP-binding protein [Natronoarchaeum philippinense]
MTDVLVADGVEKRYGDADALDGVSLSVQAGEVFALIGPNGAGKTTLVRALTGTTTPTAGSVTTFGEDPTAVARERLGVLPQDFSPPGRLTGRELVEYYAGLYEDPIDPEEVLSTVGLAEDADTWYEKLSGGQQRRVCLGAALVNDPELLFLDEPTTGIDPAGRRTVAERVRALAAAGTTVFLTTHDMDEAQRLADRVGLLSDGELVAVGPPRELVRQHGGDARLYVELDAEQADGEAAVASTPDPEAVATDLAEDGIAATPTRRGVEITGIDPTEIGRAVEAMEARGIAYSSLTWREPTLEDVYMELAGEEEGGAGGDAAVRSRAVAPGGEPR